MDISSETNQFDLLVKSVFTALETYSNVHRGSGHKSTVTTLLYENAREIVLDYLELDKSEFTVIFCTPFRAELLKAQLPAGSFYIVSEKDSGLPLGVTALAVSKKNIPVEAPFHTGGGTARLVSRGWIIWANAPDRFEAGTPAVINIIAFAKALQLTKKSGKKLLPANGKNYNSEEILSHGELKAFSGKDLLNELRTTIIGHDIIVPSSENKRYVNLDNAASTPAFGSVWNTFVNTLSAGEDVRKEIINKVREICSDALNASQDLYDIIFTSNTTESINIVAMNAGGESAGDIEPVIVNTLLEHTSDDLPWRMLKTCSTIRLNVDDDGFVNLGEMESLLSDYNLVKKHGKKRIILLALSGASNVLGSYNNLEEITRIVHKYDAHILVDAAQMIAHRKIDMGKLGADYLVFSAHKMYAPFGSGVLVARRGMLNRIDAEMNLIRSSGEENAAGIAALGKALSLLLRAGYDNITLEEQQLTARALRGMSKIPGVKIYGITDPDSPMFGRKGGVIVFGIRNLMSDEVARELALRGGIGARYGCHCAHLLVKHILKIPPFIEKFQGVIVRLFPRLNLPGVARISFGIENTSEDVDFFLRILSETSLRRPLLNKKMLQKRMNDFAAGISLKVYGQTF